MDWKYDGSHIRPRRGGTLPSQPLTLINGRAGSSLEHLVNRLHSESMEGEGWGGSAGQSAWPGLFVSVLENRKSGDWGGFINVEHLFGLSVSCSGAAVKMRSQ